MTVVGVYDFSGFDSSVVLDPASKVNPIVLASTGATLPLDEFRQLRLLMTDPSRYHVRLAPGWAIRVLPETPDACTICVDGHGCLTVGTLRCWLNPTPMCLSAYGPRK
jgi:hypothetical protein